MPQTGVRTNIFGIGEVYELQREGQWIEKNRESYREFGYFGGGEPNTLSINRIDFSNDTVTASQRGNRFSFGRRRAAATGNSNFGYYGGGQPEISVVERIDYSNDSINASIRGSLTSPTIFPKSTGNSNFGYFGGGYIPGPIVYSKLDRIDYSNDLTTALRRGNFPVTLRNQGAVSTSNFGYFNNNINIFRVNYSNDSSSHLQRGNLPDVLGDSYQNQTSVHNQNYGYFGGTESPFRSSIARIDFANDTATGLTRGPLSIPSFSRMGTGNSNFGYFGGGRTPTGVSIVDRIDYSNDTLVTSVRGPLAEVKFNGAATSPHSFGGSPVSYLGAPWVATAPYGYFSGAALGALDRVDYNNDTASTSLRSQLSVSRTNLSATGNSNFGYYIGGLIPTPAVVSTIDRIDYANDTDNASVRGNLLVADADFSAVGNSNFGYIGGSVSGSTITYRIQYSNDFVNVSSRGTLSGSRRYNAATGNANFGYFGGSFPGPLSSVDRLDYSNDTAQTSVRGSLSLIRSYLTATGNQNFGYFGGGLVPTRTSIIDRIDYANDTTTASVRGPLTVVKNNLSATGNSNFGYFGGGTINGPVNVSTVDRVDYSNDTQTASARGPLSSARTALAASSSQAYGGAPNTTTDPIPSYIRAATRWTDSNTLDVPYKRVLGSYGYFGGEGNTTGTRIDRVDYSNDTATASVRSAISVARYILGAAGNSNFGYFCGGRTPSAGPGKTTVDRIDYSNDSANVSIRTPLTSASYKTGFGNNNFGYTAHSQGGISIDRIDYSNDTNVVSKSVLYRAAYYRASTGNNNFGYVQEGLNTSALPTPGPSSIVERIDYSNDSATASIRGPLSVGRRNAAATGNSNFGYFGGGFNPSVPAVYSTIDRIDYSNDTQTASVRGPLSLQKWGSSATGNSNFGYFGNGLNPNVPAVYSTVDRIDYSNDTQTASVRGPLSSARYYFAATTNARNS